MLDLNHLPKAGNGNIDYFYNTGSIGITTTSWVTWEKPKEIGAIVITCIGAGGGGRSGWCANSNTRSGGGGGGSGGFTRVIIPTMVLPDVLYVSVGSGGAGGVSITGAASTTGMAGSDGTSSYVSIAPSTAAIYTACYANGGGGANQLSSGGNTGGTAAVVATQANCLMSGLGQFFALAGQDGAAGGLGGGSLVTYPITGLLLSGGSSGGGNQAGQVVTAPTQSSFRLIPTITGGAAAVNGVAGSDGISIFQPLMSIGGGGGGGSTSTTAGGGTGARGGNGGLGSGGGGGGGAPSGTGSGAGGKGGDGLVLIQCF